MEAAEVEEMKAAFARFDDEAISEVGVNCFRSIVAPAAIELADAIDAKLHKFNGEEVEMDFAICCSEFAEHMKEAGKFIAAFTKHISSKYVGDDIKPVDTSIAAMSAVVKRMKRSQ